MKNHWRRTHGPALLALLALATMGGVGFAAEMKTAAALEVVVNGASNYAIVIPAGDERQRVARSAKLLQAQLKTATGVELPIVSETDTPRRQPGIYLGKTKAAVAANIPFEKLKEWTYIKRAVKDDIFLAGLDASCNIKDSPKLEYLGTRKAVVAFLEDEVGVRFLTWDPKGTYTPKLTELRVSANLDLMFTPRIQYSYGIEPWWRDCDALKLAHQRVPMGYFKYYGGHSYYQAVPVETYGETHPEYFVLSGGKRVPKFGAAGWQKNHLCISNPEVQDLMLKELEKQYDLGYEWVQLGQTDACRACECEKCAALSADVGERYWIVHRKIAEEIKKRRPGKKVVIVSYDVTANPPNTFDTFPDNVVIEMARYTPADFEKWKNFKTELLVYTYNWGIYNTLGFLPKRTPSFCAEQLRLFSANNVKGIFICDFAECKALEGPIYHVYGKLAQNPELNPFDVANDYYRHAFGKAMPEMKKFFEEMYKRLELYSHNPISPWSNTPMMPEAPEDMVTYFFPPALLLSMEAHLTQAMAMDNDPDVQHRLRRVKCEFTYLKHTVACFTYYRAYRMSDSWAAFDLLESELNKRTAFINSLYGKNGTSEKEGWSFGYSPKSLEFVGRGTGNLRVPFTWDMKRIRAAKMEEAPLRKKTAKATHIAQAPSLDGVVDKEVWRNLESQALGEINLGKVNNPASFKIAYDDAHLYLAITCEQSNLAGCKLEPHGRDGMAWAQECIEMFIDPYAAREKHYHFVFNPVPNSFSDARMGFITDPLAPGYGKEDSSWNGDWQYAARIDSSNKRWTAEVKIPFATLGVATPKAGDKWLMNIGRSHPLSADAAEAELLLWSPNMEQRWFASPAAFGSVVFE